MMATVYVALCLMRRDVLLRSGRRLTSSATIVTEPVSMFGSTASATARLTTKVGSRSHRFSRVYGHCEFARRDLRKSAQPSCNNAWRSDGEAVSTPRSRARISICRSTRPSTVKSDRRISTRYQAPTKLRRRYIGLTRAYSNAVTRRSTQGIQSAKRLRAANARCLLSRVGCSRTAAKRKKRSPLSNARSFRAGDFNPSQHWTRTPLQDRAENAEAG